MGIFSIFVINTVYQPNKK
ncbi:TPA: 23S rRNA methylase leader peptide ErmCL [Enterococcus faecium]|nr:23S rRNA methylase leader peptide ErmCL [Enterococcus faecium]HBM5403865.1 23S rRNA methylase leader peptide ErmCL [Enterococcus faecium]